MPNFVFSTGKLYLGDVGAALDDANVIAAIQNATFTPSFQTKEVREAASINLFPVADAQYDADVKFAFETAELSELLIAYITGAVKSTSGGANIYTASCQSKPKYGQLKFVGVLTDGRAATLEIARAKSPSLPMGFKRDDYVQPSVEFMALPVDASAIPWKLTIAQV